MFCTHCSNQLPSEAKFCNKCGKRVETEKEQISGEKKESRENEAARVRSQVEKIKKEAMESGKPQLIDQLYHDSICYYPSWIKHVPRNYVPTMIIEADKLATEEKMKGDGLVLKMKGVEYKFIHNQSSYEDSSWGDLELFANDKKVLHVNESVSYKEWGNEYRVISVDGFIDGEWFKDFKELKNEIEKLEQERKRKEFENPDEIEKLKQNFGLE